MMYCLDNHYLKYLIIQIMRNTHVYNFNNYYILTQTFVQYSNI